MSEFAQLDFRLGLKIPEIEEKVLAYWRETNAFKRSIAERPESKPYIFYDGPPFVTGSPHYGSILGSIAKDVVPRFWTMRGYRVERQWGWDCHGLPIENMIEKELGIKNGKKGIEAYGIANFNNACRTAIAAFDKQWEVIITRIGRWVDFEHQYRTMDTTFMESVWWGFKNLFEKELIYEGRKVILYCPHCSTPLSNFEIAMDDSYVDVTEPSNTYKYKVMGESNVFLLAWSTTPWNKLATPGLAVNPNLTYVRVKQGSEEYILAESRLSMLRDEPYEVVGKMRGDEVAAREFEPHYQFFTPKPGEKAGVIVADEFVTDDAGTGIVTLAVYGEDDYRVMQAHGVQLVEHVDDEGKLKPEVTPWAGIDILEVNPLVNADLAVRGLIYSEEPHSHSVATCYRCGTRLYYAPLPAWFVDIQKMKSRLLELNETINWYPEHLKHGRFAKGIESAPDWNISRSRYWGTPMPIWQDESGKHRRILGSREELREWAVNPESVGDLTDIHREFLDDIEIWVDGARTIKGRRVPEVFDCWVESGSMPYAVHHYPFEHKEQFEQTYPAQFVSEYINQTRAWFYTLHVMSVGLFDAPAVQNIHTTGVIQAADGTKMSKSKKNYSDPLELINKNGADAMRLYLMSSPVTRAENLAFQDGDVEIMKKRVLNIWLNVVGFFAMYRPAEIGELASPPANILDQWMLARLENVKSISLAAYEGYDIVAAAREIITFVDELSTWYVRLSRDRLRGGDQEAWQVFQHVLREFALVAAPITPFMSEVTYQHVTHSQDSVHLELWPNEHEELRNEQLLEDMKSIRKVVELGHAERKAAEIKLRQPLASLATISPSPAPEEELIDLAALELNVKEIIWKQSDEDSQAILDTALTPELLAEGKAREIVRAVQNLRKEAGIDINAKIELTLPEWPAEWEDYIKEKTKANLLKKGEKISIE